ncbi:MAG: SMP-30/gluconolactonase/LRE family protein [Syntrophales bacterium]|nr:SMP-30/gluconolactonase/LRE family protein [Syntrophales bacterium]
MKIDLREVRTLGRDLVRPEGVMALDDGSLIAADGRGCCARIERSGGTSFFGNVDGVPNGICMDTEGNCIIANIGNGEVQLLSPDGSHTILMTHADGRRMYSPNFPFIDSQGRLWVSDSSSRPDIEEALQFPAPDGCMVLIDGGAPRIVADGICFANGVALDPAEDFLYVAETMKRRILRYAIIEDGSLGRLEVYGPRFLGPLGFPDGIAFDDAGNLWITFPIWNAIGYINNQGELEMVMEDPARQVLHRPANICFGWENRKTAFIGSLDGDSIPYFEVPYPGVRLIHQRS